MELSKEVWALVGALVCFALWGLLLWADEQWCKRMRVAPQWPDIPARVLVARVGIIAGFFIGSGILLSSCAVLLGYALPRLLH